MLISFAAMAAGGVLIFRGITVFDCKSVSISRKLTTCYTNDLGAMDGEIAAVLLIAVGAVFFFAAMMRFATVK
ncbi:MAG: hypothetical protein HKO63_02115 [Acidimicrobiia bacterium]|nr:hypothetical protein [Acidimicrobiia bacterium]NNF89486.1 hypothetical protein [Acidimicrobiia bacterium]NNJ46681.1 hypothetical protein [Acidimicrobiia bacterium]NNL14290.1 hypothetical protein [Acidimicrobiia bacterium]NNL96978.1 hypothetical protein [Acidimicrobiia bacterium]